MMCVCVCLSDDMTIKLWDWDRKWTCSQVFEGHTHYVMQVVFNPKDNNQFASGSLDRTIKVQHTRVLYCTVHTNKGHPTRVPSGQHKALVLPSRAAVVFIFLNVESYHSFVLSHNYDS